MFGAMKINSFGLYNAFYLIIGVTAGDPTSSIYDQIGITTFNVNSDKIIDIVRNYTEGKFDYKAFGLQPENHIGEMHGGRSMAFFSSEDVLRTVKDCEVFIISSIADSFGLRNLLSYLTPDNLPKSCIIVFRLPFEERPYYGASNVTDLMKFMRIDENGDQIITEKKFSRKNKKQTQKHNRKIFSIGLEKLGGVEPDHGIKQLHSALFQKEVTTEIMKPVKETLSAGKSLVNWGRSFRNWISGSSS